MAALSWETGWDGPTHFNVAAERTANLTSFLLRDHSSPNSTHNGGLFFWIVPTNESFATIPPSPSPTAPGGRDPALARAEIGVLGLVLALTALGNGFVLWVLLRRRKHHAPMHLFMVNLCVADLVVAFFQVLPQLLWDITERFQGPDALCRLVKYLQIVGMFASSYMIVAMTVDRHHAICCPLQAYRGMATSRWNTPIMVAWGLALALSLPQVFIFSRSEVSPGEFECWGHFMEPWGLKAYVTWMTVAVFVLPALIITVCQVRIFREIHDNIYLKSKRVVSAELKKNSVFFNFHDVGRGSRRGIERGRTGVGGRATEGNGRQFSRGSKSSSSRSHHKNSPRNSCFANPTNCNSLAPPHRNSSGDASDAATKPSSGIRLPSDDPVTHHSCSATVSTSPVTADPPESVCTPRGRDCGLPPPGPSSSHCSPPNCLPKPLSYAPPAPVQPPSVSKAMSKTVRMTLVIVLVYTMCWSPFFVVQLWSAWDPNPPNQGVAFTILMLLASLNSCTNPWIYTAFSSSVSRDLQSLLGCHPHASRRGSLPDDSTTTTHTSTTAKDNGY